MTNCKRKLQQYKEQRWPSSKQYLNAPSNCIFHLCFPILHQFFHSNSSFISDRKEYWINYWAYGPLYQTFKYQLQQEKDKSKPPIIFYLILNSSWALSLRFALFQAWKAFHYHDFFLYWRYHTKQIHEYKRSFFLKVCMPPYVRHFVKKLLHY